MTEPLRIEKAQPSDLLTLYSICRQSYSENFSNHWNEGGLEWYLEKTYGKRIIEFELSGTTVNYYIAFLNDEPVGFMKLDLCSNVPGQVPEEGMEISKLYFLPIHQGKGIGKKLISIAFELAKKLKKKTVWLGVIDTNDSAIQFYTRMGFHLQEKTRLDIPYFKEELKGMWRMALDVGT